MIQRIMGLSFILIDQRKLGHIHLKVGDIPAARILCRLLGFDITFKFDTALFVSVGGYHHHIGMNTWENLGAGKRGQNLGMGKVRFILPDADDLSRLSRRLDESKIKFVVKQNEITVNDPWATNWPFWHNHKSNSN